MSKGVDLAAILACHGADYSRRHSLSAQQSKVLGSIIKCRTAALGGHLCACTDCGCTRVFYNSCRDRHCPKCQSLATEKWLRRREEELLPVPHFHLVFTVPTALHDLLRHNDRKGYNALFQTAWSSLKTLCADQKYLGADAGAMAVLHTWGQNLHYHPHLHFLVPAGGLSFDGKRWKSPRSAKFLVPVRALSRLFRGRLVSTLRKQYKQGVLQLPAGQSLRDILNAAMAKEWVVYAKPPFAGPRHLLGYLGRYVKRIAISNDRILSLANGRVRFRYRDYADGNKQKVMCLKADEFIRRFVQHILPSGFCKVRYYGLLATRNRTTRLGKCHELLGSELQRRAKLNWEALYEEVTGQPPNRCTDCGGLLLIVNYSLPARSPPWSKPVLPQPSTPALHPQTA